MALKDNLKKKAGAPGAIEQNAAETAPAKEKKEKKSKLKYLEPNQMNFYEQYKLVVEGKKKDVDIQKIIAPLAAVLVVILLVYAGTFGYLFTIKSKNKALSNYINDANNIATYNLALETKAQIGVVGTNKSNLETILEAIDSYPNLGAKFFVVLDATAKQNNITIGSYSYSNQGGSLSVSCTSKTTQDISNFVRAMEKNGLLSLVTYTGFSGSSESYSFSLTCRCLGNVDMDSLVVDDAPAQNTQTEAEQTPANNNG